MTIMYSVKEAAEIMGISERRVRELLNDGTLRGKKLSPRVWVVQTINYKRRRRPKMRSDRT